MKSINRIFLITFLLSACAPAATIAPTFTPQPTETLTPSPTATQTPSPTPTITPTPTPAGGGLGKFIFEYHKAGFEKSFPDLEGELQVFISNIDGTDLTPVAHGLKSINRIESISPDGKLVVISSRSSQLAKGELYLVHLNLPGADPTKLAHGVEPISRWPQARFIDSHRIVYIAQGSQGYGFYTAKIDGTSPVKIGAPIGKAWGIASSDKSRLYWYAYTNERFKDSFGILYAYGDIVSLWWTNLDGSGQDKLESNGHQIFPTGVFPTGIGEGVAFSPDGTIIAWIPGNLEQDCSGLLGTFWTPAVKDGTYTELLERPSQFLNKDSPYLGKVVDIPFVEGYVRRCNLLHVAPLSDLDKDTKIPLIPPFNPTKDDFLYHKDYVLRWWPDSSKILLYEDGFVTWDAIGRSPFTLYAIDPKDTSPGLVLIKVLSHSSIIQPGPGIRHRFIDSFGSFEFSPDGRQMLFRKYNYGYQGSMIKVLDLETMNYMDDFGHNVTPDFQIERVGNIYWLP